VSETRFWKPPVIIAFVLGTIGALAMAAVIALGVAYGVRWIRGPIDAVNDYVAALNDGDAQTAWDLLDPSSDIRREQSFEEFTTTVVEPAEGILRTWRTGSVDISNTNRASVEVTESLRTGGTRELRFRLRKSGDDWLITDYFVI
jgi:hypothetical protein